MRVGLLLLIVLTVGCRSTAPAPHQDFLSSYHAPPKYVEAWKERRKPEDAVRIAWIAGATWNSALLSTVLTGASTGKEREVSEVIYSRESVSSETLDAVIERVEIDGAKAVVHVVLWSNGGGDMYRPLKVPRAIPAALYDGRWKVDMQPLLGLVRRLEATPEGEK